MKHHFPLFAAAAMALVGGVVPAQAQDSLDEPRQVVVRYDDLNLAQPNGRARLERRLLSAVNNVCRVREVRTLDERYDALACRKRAMTDMQPRVAAALRKAGALYAGRPGE